MKRREFITLLGGTAVAWPLAARAQQPKVPTVGFLNGTSPEAYAQFVSELRQGLRDAGHVEGQNVAIEFRWAQNQYNRLPELAADLVSRRVAVIVTSGTNAAEAAKAATSSIPIVSLVAADPIKSGLVSSFNRPEGNLTSVSLFGDVIAKHLELVRELAPTSDNVAVLINPLNQFSAIRSNELRKTALSNGRRIEIFNAGTGDEIDRAFAEMEQLRIGALAVQSDPLFFSRRNQIIILAARHALPAIYPWREATEIGGLVSYGPDRVEAYHQVANYAVRILKGAKIADLPVTQPTKFELVINLRTAKAIGLTVPESFLVRADEVIE